MTLPQQLRFFGRPSPARAREMGPDLRAQQLRRWNRKRLPSSGFVVPIFANSLTHIAWFVAFGNYAPGVATSLLLLAPIGGHLMWACTARRCLDRIAVVALLMLALLSTAIALVSRRELSDGQIRVQDAGGHFADWIWPAE